MLFNFLAILGMNDDRNKKKNLRMLSSLKSRFFSFDVLSRERAKGSYF